MLNRMCATVTKLAKVINYWKNIWASFHPNLHIHNQYHSIMLLVGAKQLSAWPANFRHSEHAAWLLSHTVQLQAPGTWTHGLQTIGLCLHPRCPASCSRAPSRYRNIKEQHFPYLYNICTSSSFYFKTGLRLRFRRDNVSTDNTNIFKRTLTKFNKYIINHILCIINGCCGKFCWC